MIRAIYIEQLGGWWRLTIDDWHDLLRRGAVEGAHDLSHLRCLKERPRPIGLNSSGPKKSYYSKVPSVLVYQPLDWRIEDYQSALKDLEEKLK